MPAPRSRSVEAHRSLQRDPVIPCSLLHGERSRRDKGMGLGIVVVIDNGGSGERFQSKSRLETERKLCSPRLRPQIDNQAIRLDIVFIQVPTGIAFRILERL